MRKELVRSVGIIRHGLDWELAFGFSERVAEQMKFVIPEIAHRWPMKSMRISNFIRDDLLVVTIDPIPEETRREVATGAPRPLASQVYESWKDGITDFSEFADLVSLAHPDQAFSRFAIPFKLPVHLRHEEDVQSVVAAWTDSDRELFERAVSYCFQSLFMEALSHPPSEDSAEDIQPTVVNPLFGNGHPSFPQPANLNMSVWRYMSLGKLVSLLSTSSLFFARGDVLGDNWEGALGIRNQAYERPHADLDALASLNYRSSDARPNMFISCWYAQEYESVAMWGLYAEIGSSGSYGVALRSSYLRLIESIGGENQFHAGKVSYRNYEKDFISTMNAFDPWMSKRESFGHEAEI